MEIMSACQKVSQLFNASWMNEQAKRVGLCKRLRRIQPLPLSAAMVAGLGDGKVTAIADLHRTFNGLGMSPEAMVAYKPFHNQLRKQSFATFMQALAKRAMVLFSQQWSQDIPGLSQFEQVLLHDGSSFALHKQLAEVFPGRFKKLSPAAVECHMTMSLLDDQPLALSVSADTSAERRYLPEPMGLRNRLLLCDAGYPQQDYLSQVNQHGGFYLMRHGKNWNPLIRQANNSKGRKLDKLVGKRLQDIRRRDSRSEVLDLEVDWAGHRVRVIRFWHQESKRYLSWMTNLSTEQFSAEQVMKLYRLRWQIELLFKEWKSHNNLHKFNTRQRYLAEGLIWASLLSLLVKRLVGRAAAHLAGKRLSTLKMAKFTQGWLEPMMKSLTTGFTQQLAIDLHWAVELLARTCCRDQQSKAKKSNSLEGILEAFGA
ncbi:IS4 family transposase [Bowmanella dokdonensis]|uniref:IS4 family transposase n=1 Tax=Bowmanella dokdonensis TaxID=751969 RepID=A0A939IT34_9ALTE|nr:IS4 family transposase [Bowmanella dokdonensis]MBN7827789.1 IS4 family transposase [Bowmanella dokdonensis]